MKKLISSIKDFLIHDWMHVLMGIAVVFAMVSSYMSRSAIVADADVEATKAIIKQMADNPEPTVGMMWLSLAFFLFFMSGLFLIFRYVWLRLQGKELIQPAADTFHAFWTLRDVIKTIIVVLFLGIVASYVLVWAVRSFGMNPSLPIWSLLHTGLIDLFMLLAIYYCVVIKYKGSRHELGFAKIEPGKDLTLGASGYLAFLPILLGIMLVLKFVLDLFQYEPEPHELITILLKGDLAPWMVAVSLVLACVVAPVMEEIFFRGFCYPAFRSRFGILWAMILSSVFFALLHQNVAAFVPIFFLGMLLAFFYEKRRTLTSSIVIHVIHNSLTLGYFFILQESLKKAG